MPPAVALTNEPDETPNHGLKVTETNFMPVRLQVGGLAADEAAHLIIGSNYPIAYDALQYLFECTRGDARFSNRTFENSAARFEGLPGPTLENQAIATEFLEQRRAEMSEREFEKFLRERQRLARTNRALSETALVAVTDIYDLGGEKPRYTKIPTSVVVNVPVQFTPSLSIKVDERQPGALIVSLNRFDGPKFPKERDRTEGALAVYRSFVDSFWDQLGAPSPWNSTGELDPSCRIQIPNPARRRLVELVPEGDKIKLVGQILRSGEAKTSGKLKAKAGSIERDYNIYPHQVQIDFLDVGLTLRLLESFGLVDFCQNASNRLWPAIEAFISNESESVDPELLYELATLKDPIKVRFVQQALTSNKAFRTIGDANSISISGYDERIQWETGRYVSFEGLVSPVGPVAITWLGREWAIGEKGARKLSSSLFVCLEEPLELNESGERAAEAFTRMLETLSADGVLPKSLSESRKLESVIVQALTVDGMIFKSIAIGHREIMVWATPIRPVPKGDPTLPILEEVESTP